MLTRFYTFFFFFWFYTFFSENIFSLFMCALLVNEFLVTFVQRSFIWNQLFVTYFSSWGSVYFDRLKLSIKLCFMKGVFLSAKRVKQYLILDNLTVSPILWSFCSGMIIHQVFKLYLKWFGDFKPQKQFCL